jgi:CheY-like chemotaxis protein
MTNKILLVDDDPKLLNSLKRNLCIDYDLAIAESGQLALERLEALEQFCVIVTDMRMPHMDGVQFIEKARQLAPNTVYLMLTGNQDIQTAMKAVNDGQVFRFLNKPCEMAEIKRALDAALTQYRLIHAEKELLQKTFVGAVNLLSDVLDSLRPDIVQQSHRIDSVMRACEEALGFCGNWEYRIAARLGLVGLALQPLSEQERFQQLSPADPTSRLLFDEVLSTSARMIERIPRLTPIVEILRAPQLADGAVSLHDIEHTTPALGALLLRIATYWTTLTTTGIAPATALNELQQAFPDIPFQIMDALLALEGEQSLAKPLNVELQNLAEGMVLYDDVHNEDGAIILRKGRRLTAASIEKLRLSIRKLKAIYVVDTSIMAEAKCVIAAQS